LTSVSATSANSRAKLVVVDHDVVIIIEMIDTLAVIENVQFNLQQIIGSCLVESNTSPSYRGHFFVVQLTALPQTCWSNQAREFNFLCQLGQSDVILL
jgi:hypothetical protein